MTCNVLRMAGGRLCDQKGFLEDQVLKLKQGHYVLVLPGSPSHVLRQQVARVGVGGRV